VTQTVTAEDGTIHKFPDKATPEMISEALGLSPPDKVSGSASAPSFGDELKRQGGLAVRAGVEGALSIPAVFADIGYGITRKAIGAKTKAIYPSEAVSQALTAIGVPEPQSGTERIVQDISRSAVGVGSLVKLASTKAVKAISPAISKFLSGNPLALLGSSVGSSGATGIAREAGFGPGVQSVVGVVGGFGGGATGQKFDAKAAIGSGSQLIKEIEQKGIEGAKSIDDVSAALKTEKINLEKQMQAAFGAAEEKGLKAFVDKKYLKSLISQISKMSIETADDAAEFAFKKTTKRLVSLLKSDNITVNDIEKIRRSASDLFQSGGGKAAAGYKMKTAIHEFLKDALAAGKITGDKTAISLWNRGIGLRSQITQKFETPSAIETAVGKDAIEKIEKVFLGGSGPVRAEASQIYDDMISALPEDAAVMAGEKFRQGIFNKIVRNAIRNTGGDDAISSQSMISQIKNLRIDNKSMWSKFTIEERKILSQLESNLRKESASGVIDTVGRYALRFINRMTFSRFYIPQPLKDAHSLTMKELIDLTKSSPPLIDPFETAAVGTIYGTLSTREKK